MGDEKIVRTHAGLNTATALLTHRMLQQFDDMVFSDVGGYPRKMARHTERCFYSYNARGALPAEEALQESPQYRFVDGLVNADTVFDTRVVVAVNSIYYPGVFAAVRRHVGSGGEAYVIVHCADHSGHTWGDEAYVSVCNG